MSGAEPISRPLVGQPGAQVAEVAAAGPRAGRPGCSWPRGDVEQRLDLASRGTGGRSRQALLLGVEHHPQQAAGRVDAVGDAVRVARRERSPPGRRSPTEKWSSGRSQQASPERMNRISMPVVLLPGVGRSRRRCGTGSSRTARSRGCRNRRRRNVGCWPRRREPIMASCASHGSAARSASARRRLTTALSRGRGRSGRLIDRARHDLEPVAGAEPQPVEARPRPPAARTATRRPLSSTRPSASPPPAAGRGWRASSVAAEDRERRGALADLDRAVGVRRPTRSSGSAPLVAAAARSRCGRGRHRR